MHAEHMRGCLSESSRLSKKGCQVQQDSAFTLEGWIRTAPRVKSHCLSELVPGAYKLWSAQKLYNELRDAIFSSPKLSKLAALSAPCDQIEATHRPLVRMQVGCPASNPKPGSK